MTWRRGRTHFPCYTGTTRDVKSGSVVQAESFTAMVVADLLIGHREHGPLVRSISMMLERELGRGDVFHFFKDHERLPADADCTSMGLSVLLRAGARLDAQAHRALDRILANVDADGVVETYFDPTHERDGIVDPVVCANVLYFAYQLGRGHEVEATLEYVRRVLVERRYLEGTRYYHSPDSLLYFLGRVVHTFPETHEALLEPLREAVRERLGATCHVIDRAQRVLLSVWLGIDDGGELEALVDLQKGSGLWGADALFRYGRKKVFFGSQVLSNVFAMIAVRHGMARAAAPARVDEDAITERLSVDRVDNVTYAKFG